MITPGAASYPNVKRFSNQHYPVQPAKRRKRVPVDRDNYPIHYFPPKARDLIYNLSLEIGCPIAAVGAVLIGVCSICCQDKIQVRKTANLTSPTNIWILMAQMSGERKTTLLNMLLKPIREYEKRLNDELDVKIKRHEIEMELWNDLRRAIKKDLKKHAVDEVLEALEKHEKEKPEKPKMGRLIHESATIEALIKNMGEYSASTSIITDEFSCIVKSRMLNQVGLLCKTFDGADLIVDRAVSGTTKITDALTTLLIMGQPEVIQKYITKHWTELDSTGFLPRMLISSLQPTAGDRTYEDKIDSNMEHLAWFHTRVNSILMSGGVGDDAKNEPKILSFTPEAESLWKEYHDSVERKMKEGQIYERFRAYASRMADKVARLSALLHYVFEGDGPIEKSTLENCIEIIEWYSDMYVKILGFESLTADEKNVSRLAQWLYDRHNKGRGAVSRVEIMQYGPKSVRRKSVLDAVLSDMAGQSLVMLSKDCYFGRDYIEVTNKLVSSCMTSNCWGS